MSAVSAITNCPEYKNIMSRFQQQLNQKNQLLTLALLEGDEALLNQVHEMQDEIEDQLEHDLHTLCQWKLSSRFGRSKKYSHLRR